MFSKFLNSEKDLIQLKNKVLIIIPAFNEELNIKKTIEDLRKQNLTIDILVINDASLDQTSLAARETGAIVVDLPCNLGIGGAVQTGYIYAWEHGYDVAVQFDGDGQHRGDELYNLLKPLEDDEADMVIGSRFVKESEGFKSTFFRRIGIYYFATILTMILGQKITDPTSGFRAVNRRLIRYFVEYYPDDYPEPEVLVYLHRKKVRVKEISVLMQEREFGKSSIHFVRSVYYVIKVTLAILINLIRF